MHQSPEVCKLPEDLYTRMLFLFTHEPNEAPKDLFALAKMAAGGHSGFEFQIIGRTMVEKRKALVLGMISQLMKIDATPAVGEWDSYLDLKVKRALRYMGFTGLAQSLLDHVQFPQSERDKMTFLLEAGL